MAPESLTEMVFSSQSDVWSFGVVMWELFSLGKVPYPGLFDVKQLISDLQNGYRMEKPQFASNEIGRLMTQCWKDEPKERLKFHQLEEDLTKHLEASVYHHYLQMNYNSALSRAPMILKLDQENEECIN